MEIPLPYYLTPDWDEAWKIFLQVSRCGLDTLEKDNIPFYVSSSFLKIFLFLILLGRKLWRIKILMI